MEDQIFSQTKQHTELVPAVPLNVARRRRPRRFNPPLKKDATSSQTSASEDNIGTTVLCNSQNAADSPTTVDTSPRLTDSLRTTSKGNRPPQHGVQSSRKGRKHGRNPAGDNSCLTEASKDADCQDTTNRPTNKRMKKSDAFHGVQQRQMDVTSAGVNSIAVPEDFGDKSEEERMEESQDIEVEQVEQSQRIHTVLSYCDESHHAGGNIHAGTPVDELEQDEYIHHGESEEDMEDLDVVTCDTPYPHCGDPDSNPIYQSIHGVHGGVTMESEHRDQTADLCVQCDHSQESESDSESIGIPRRQFKVPSSRPCAYNFSILPLQPPTKGITSRRKVSTRKKRVTLDENHNTSIPLLQVREQHNVFDFQPSQDSTRGTDVGDVDTGKGEQRCGKSTLNQSRSMLDISYSKRTREEQLAVDIEVLQVIARTRMDIRAIRAKYAAMKTGRIPLPQVIHPTRGAAIEVHVTKPATYEFGQEGYLGYVSAVATSRKTVMAQEVHRRAQMMKEE